VEARGNRPGLPMANICQKEDDSTFWEMSLDEPISILSYKNYKINRFYEEMMKQI